MSSNYHFIDKRSGMVIVSKCPRCGAPIYAPNMWDGDEAPPISHTCECRHYHPLGDYLPRTSPITEGTGQPPPLWDWRSEEAMVNYLEREAIRHDKADDEMGIPHAPRMEFDVD